ncbi:FkbM family methyltransferase [Tardiphaga sp. 709]|uniref:FkbM family methyltransferase n=1 Tax=Tardiphaga sp. 709 TaxID=3076039 RepID=UPI0028E6B10F|nr:FkbM family methyltransferase [Tardiphaga sp. 709]WNV09601.1 FkbM family methyltransferase [Tardiphaga sp. 709]
MFQLGKFELSNGAHATAVNDTLSVRGTAGRWSYIVSFLNGLSVVDAARFGPAEIRVNVSLHAGKIEICAVGTDWKSFADQHTFVAREPVILRVNNLAEVLGIVIRNADSDDAATFVVERIEVSPGAIVSKPTHRGFGEKSALADIKRVSGSPLSTILDVGANVGDTTYQFVEAFPEARIHSFEPHPTTCQHAASRFTGNLNVSFHNAAAGSAAGFLELNSYSNSAINSVHAIANSAQVDGEVSLVETVRVPSITLDSFVLEHSLKQIDLLKIDTQGYEVDVLRGAESLLATKKVSFIVAELLFVPIYAGQCYHSDVSQLLRKFGYRLYDYYDFVYSDDGSLKWGDGLYIAEAS